MESVRSDLVILVQLQNTYDRIAEAIRERQTPPPEVQELQEQDRSSQLELDELERQAEVHAEELAEVRKKEQEWQVELEHFQRQKSTVTNEREFTAVISEIDYATKALQEAESRRQELEEAIEGLNQDVASRRDARPEEESAHREVVEGWESRKEKLRKIVHGLAVDAKKKEEQLKPKHRARFLRLLENKKGTAVAAVVEGSCSVCHFAVRPHLQQRVRRCEEIISCEYCDRILYVTQSIEEGAPEVSAG